MLMFGDAVWAGTSLIDLGIYFLASRSCDRGEIRASSRLDFVGSDAGSDADEAAISAPSGRVNGESAYFRGWGFGFRRVGDKLETTSQVAKTMADDRGLRQPALGVPPMEVDSSIRYVAPSGRFWMQYGLRNV